MAGCSREESGQQTREHRCRRLGNLVAPGKVRRVCSGFIAAVLAFTAAFVLCWPPRAQAAPAPARFWVDRPYYEAGGRQYTMDVAPYLSGERTFIPVRYLACALGVPEEGVQWDGATRAVSLHKGSIVLRLVPGSSLLERQTGKGPPVSLVMDVAPEVRSGRVFLPARYVAAGLGYGATWDPVARQVTLAPGEIPWPEELLFDPNPVEPGEGLSIRLRAGGPALPPLLRLKGAGGPGDPNEYSRVRQFLGIRHPL